MATRNDITGDLIQSKKFSQNYDKNYDAIFGKKNEVLTLSTGEVLEKCGSRCWLEVKSDLFVCNKPKCEVINDRRKQDNLSKE